MKETQSLLNPKTTYVTESSQSTLLSRQMTCHQYIER